jgi:hypothetical protein
VVICSLKLWRLIDYGIIIIQPAALVGIYDIVSNVARRHVVSAILFGTVGVVFTAISDGRMAAFIRARVLHTSTPAVRRSRLPAT